MALKLQKIHPDRKVAYEAELLSAASEACIPTEPGVDQASMKPVSRMKVGGFLESSGVTATVDIRTCQRTALRF